DRHVRVQGVGLKHHRDVAVLGGDVVDDPVADQDPPFADLLEPRQHAQRGGLAAAGGADEHHELLVFDLDVEVLDDREVRGVALDYVVISYRCHLFIPSPSTTSMPRARALPHNNSIYLLLIGKSEFAFFFQAEDGIRGYKVTGVQTCALPI